MAWTIARSVFDDNEDPKYLVSDDTLNINGIDCIVFESQTTIGRDFMTPLYKAEVRALKGFQNEALYDYLKGNIQRLHSQIAMKSNPFKVKFGDYRLITQKVSLTTSADSFSILFDGMLCQPLPSDAL